MTPPTAHPIFQQCDDVIKDLRTPYERGSRYFYTVSKPIVKRLKDTIKAKRAYEKGNPFFHHPVENVVEVFNNRFKNDEGETRFDYWALGQALMMQPQHAEVEKKKKMKEEEEEEVKKVKKEVKKDQGKQEQGDGNGEGRGGGAQPGKERPRPKPVKSLPAGHSNANAAAVEKAAPKSKTNKGSAAAPAQTGESSRRREPKKSRAELTDTDEEEAAPPPKHEEPEDMEIPKAVVPKSKGKAKVSAAADQPPTPESDTSDALEELVDPQEDAPLVRAQRIRAAKQLEKEQAKVFQVFWKCLPCEKREIDCVYTQARVAETKNGQKVVCDHCKAQKGKCRLGKGPGLQLTTPLYKYEELMYPKAEDGSFTRKTMNGELLPEQDFENEKTVVTLGHLLTTAVSEQRILGERINGLRAEVQEFASGMDTTGQMGAGTAAAIGELTTQLRTWEKSRIASDAKVSAALESLADRMTRLEDQVVKDREFEARLEKLFGRLDSIEMMQRGGGGTPPPKSTRPQAKQEEDEDDDEDSTDDDDNDDNDLQTPGVRAGSESSDDDEDLDLPVAADTSLDLVRVKMEEDEAEITAALEMEGQEPPHPSNEEPADEEQEKLGGGEPMDESSPPPKPLTRRNTRSAAKKTEEDKEDEESDTAADPPRPPQPASKPTSKRKATADPDTDTAAPTKKTKPAKK